MKLHILSCFSNVILAKINQIASKQTNLLDVFPSTLATVSDCLPEQLLQSVCLILRVQSSVRRILFSFAVFVDRISPSQLQFLDINDGVVADKMTLLHGVGFQICKKCQYSIWQSVPAEQNYIR